MCALAGPYQGAGYAYPSRTKGLNISAILCGAAPGAAWYLKVLMSGA